MISKDNVFYSNDMKAIWQKFCGFLDLSVEEFMGIQETLLFNQIDIFTKNKIGKHIHILGDAKT